MNDDHFQKRMRELRDEETAQAPSFERVLRGRPTPNRGRMRLAWPAFALMALALVAFFFWPTTQHDSLPEISPAALADLESAEWSAPTDALLTTAGAPASPDLYREITQLLNQP